MISGILAISIAFVAATVSAAAFWLYYKDRNERYLNLGNRTFFIQGIAVVFSVFLLYVQILSHNFRLNYVYSYTSRKLSLNYLISSFWAGQEGTFLLWLFFGIIYGIVLIRLVSRKEPMVMFFLMLVQSFILLILLEKSPFAMIWHIHPDVPEGFMPIDGAGLNPLLQNPWMIIHPPVMFVGYSSTVVTFAFALNAMVKKDLHQWVKYARPWVIFSALTLGAGIILGGYWSYVTLGWGGYWAWDPVENASLVPWVLTVALLHGIIIQIRQKGLVKTNLFLAGLSFISVLWGSFLTRSGVLADFSVHSFAESDINLYLITFVSFFAGLFLHQYFKAIRGVESYRFSEGLFSRETFILIGLLTLLFTGIFVFIGTSAPIYTGLFGQPSNVSVDFYNTITIPIAMFMLISMAIAPLLAWKVSELRNVKTLLLSTVVSVFVTIFSILLGLNQPLSIILVFLSIFTVLLNGHVAYRFVKKVPAKAGGYLTHIGVAFMVIGIIISSLYDRSEKVTLPQGQFVKTDFGYDIQFVRFVNSPDGKDRVKLVVRKDGKIYEANPQFYYSEYTKSYMISPYVKVALDKDVYISPISFMPAQYSNSKKVTLTKQSSSKVGDLDIIFNRFIVGNHFQSSNMTVKADLTVKYKQNNYQKEFSVQPAIWVENGKIRADEIEIPETDYKIRLEKLDANSGSVVLSVFSSTTDKTAPQDILAIEVSEKPLISILWLGTIIMILGLTLAFVDRIKDKLA